jgi:hypothetical protein
MVRVNKGSRLLPKGGAVNCTGEGQLGSLTGCLRTLDGLAPIVCLNEIYATIKI